jgi:hypothetical protein
MPMRHLIIAALALAACTAPEAPVEADSGTAGFGASVTYRYGTDVGEAHAQAAAYCGKYRRRAYLRSTTRDGDQNLATFDCR